MNSHTEPSRPPDDRVQDPGGAVSHFRRPSGTAAPVGARSARRIVFLVLGVVAGAVLVTLLALFVQDRLRLRAHVRDLASDDPDVCRRALHEVARVREARATEAIREVLASAQDRAVVEMAGYALMRVRDPDGLAILRERVERDPDDLVRAKLIVHAARLADRDPAPAGWMREGLEAPEPWRRAGSAAGLLILGHPDAGERLLMSAREDGPDVRGFALEEFEAIARPLFEAVGRPFDEWDELAQAPPRDPRWAELVDRWRRVATAPLLNDVLTRLHRREPLWHQQNRLLHARDRVGEYVAPNVAGRHAGKMSEEK